VENCDHPNKYENTLAHLKGFWNIKKESRRRELGFSSGGRNKRASLQQPTYKIVVEGKAGQKI